MCRPYRCSWCCCGVRSGCTPEGASRRHPTPACHPPTSKSRLLQPPHGSEGEKRVQTGGFSDPEGSRHPLATSLATPCIPLVRLDIRATDSQLSTLCSVCLPISIGRAEERGERGARMPAGREISDARNLTNPRCMMKSPRVRAPRSSSPSWRGIKNDALKKCANESLRYSHDCLAERAASVMFPLRGRIFLNVVFLFFFVCLLFAFLGFGRLNNSSVRAVVGLRIANAYSFCAVVFFFQREV